MSGATRAPAAARALPAFVAPLLVAAVAIALHAQSLAAPFYGDDFWYLDHVRVRTLWSALVDPSPIGPFFRPWSANVHWWFLARLSGEEPLGFHVANLVLFLGVLGLVFALGRRLAGGRAGIAAAALVALHPAPEAAVRWVAGSQDLWATLAGLACVLLHRSGRRVLAAIALLVALFSKETALVVPLVAVLLDARAGEPWWAAPRRGAWLGLALLAWAALWIPSFTASLAGNAGYVSTGPAGVPAALWHFACVLTGLEGTPSTRIGFPSPGPLAGTVAFVALAGLAMIVRRRMPEAPRVANDTVAAWRLIVAALIAALPIAAVAPVWSGYQYTLALCLAAIAIGAFLARVRTAWAFMVAIGLGLGAMRGWGIEEMDARVDAWKPLSRVNGFYLRRAEEQSAQYLAQLRQLRPTLPPRSTVLFGGLPGLVGWQSGNGAILRWAYRDTTLRSRFLSEFSAADTARGPVFYFTAARGALQEIEGPARHRHVAGGLLLSDQLDGANVALAVAVAETPGDAAAHYLRAWLALDRGDSTGALDALARARVIAAPGPLPRQAEIERIAAGGDVEGAVELLAADLERHELDADGHALLADLLLPIPAGEDGGTIEAFAARALRPDDWTMWKRWGLLQARTSRPAQALRSLEKARALRAGLPPDPVLERAVADLRGATAGRP